MRKMRSTPRRSKNLDLGTDDEEEEDIDDDLEGDFEIETFTSPRTSPSSSARWRLSPTRLARDTIMTAFREGLVDESTTSKKEVDEHYAEAEESLDDDGEIDLELAR